MNTQANGDDSKEVGRKNIVAGLLTLGTFMFLGFVLVYLRDFAPNAAEWAAQYSTGAHFETRLSHVHGTLFGFLNVVIGFLLGHHPLSHVGTRLVSWLSLGGILMPVGILGEVVLGTSPVFVLVGATSMTAAMVVYGVLLLSRKNNGTRAETSAR